MFTYRYGGKNAAPRKLVISDDKVVVRTREPVETLGDAVTLEPSREALRAFERLDAYSYPEANVSVLQNRAAPSERASYQARARAHLKQEPGIRFAGRVLEDAATGEPVVYTENLFVKFRDAETAATCRRILEEAGLSVKDRPAYATNAYFVAADGSGLDVFRIAEALLERDEVESAHPELIQRRARRAIAPQQWHLAPTTLGGSEIDAHVNVEAAWRYSRGKGATIAIIDDAVDIDHPEFTGRIVEPHDVWTLGPDPRPRDPFTEAHGTACAGVACAGGRRASGIAPEAKLMPIRLAQGIGLGSYLEAAAFHWAVQNGADVISCSWGPADGTGGVTPLPDHTRLAIDYAVGHGRGGKGCAVLWAAGNGNESIETDGYASYEAVLAVAACNDASARSAYSDFGENIWCCFPSDDAGHLAIHTTLPGGAYTDDFGGTSSACPGVAGIVALILAVHPELTGREVRTILRLCAEPIDVAGGGYDSDGHSPLYGYGRPDAAAAVAMARQMRAAFRGGDDVLSQGAQLEAITVRLAPERRDAVAAHLRTERTLDPDWQLEAVEHSAELLDLLPGRARRVPPREAWNLTYRLRAHPEVLAAEPSFVMPAPGVADEARAQPLRSALLCPHDPKTDVVAGEFEWSVRQVRVPQAWRYSQRSATATGAAFGAGIRIGHPDSGYREHRELEPDRLLLDDDRDFIDEDDDTLVPAPDGNHGLGTASVLVSGRAPLAAPPFVTGVAPEAELMPLRVAKSTLFPIPVLVFGGMRRLRRAIDHAVDRGCHVISISLGGLPNAAAHEAIQRAVERGVVVLAAAGNVVPWVVWPASYAEVIAVAGNDVDARPWRFSSAGPAVDVTAPGASVWRALVGEDGSETVVRSCGTSFSVAITAGLAALWLAHHGRDALLERYGAAGLVTAFREVLTASCSPKPALPGDRFGAGLVNAEALLKRALPAARRMRARRHLKRIPSTMDHLANLFADAPRTRVRRELGRLLAVERSRLGEAVEDVGDELLFHFATDPQLYRSFRGELAQVGGKRSARWARARLATRARRQLLIRGASERLAGYLQPA